MLLAHYLVQHSMETYASQGSVDDVDGTINLHPGEQSNSPQLNSLASCHHCNASQNAKNQRENLKTYFVTNGAVPWQDSKIV